ncbi:MAG: hypothetical protein ACLQLG_06140 [Thermoguttaceae bacterium]
MIPTGIFAIFLVMALIGISIRLVAGGMDRERIEDYIRQRGGRIISVTWSPFGKGWFGEQNARIYEVVYYDGQQNQHMATCKTSMFGGVYFTGDEISHARAAWADRVPDDAAQGKPLLWSIANAGPPPDEAARLKEENARLREELERLRGGG